MMDFWQKKINSGIMGKEIKVRMCIVCRKRYAQKVLRARREYE